MHFFLIQFRINEEIENFVVKQIVEYAEYSTLKCIIMGNK